MSDESCGGMMGRRRFLEVVGLGSALVVVGSAGCGDASTPPAPFSAGRVADHPQGTYKLYTAHAAIVGRDAGGYFAFTAICTHEASTVTFQSGATACEPAVSGCAQSTVGAFRCPNHGSTFDANGDVTQGPATRGLQHFQVTVSAGEITVNPGVNVGANARSMAG